MLGGRRFGKKTEKNVRHWMEELRKIKAYETITGNRAQIQNYQRLKTKEKW
jgi:hypothetical protein